MPEAVEKPEDRDIEELMRGMIKGARDIVEGRTNSIGESRGQPEESE